MVFLSHVTGNLNSKQAALCLAENNWLSECHTTLGWNDESKLGAYLPKSLVGQLQKRSFPPLVKPFLRLHPSWEILRLALRNRSFPLLKNWASIDHVAKCFDNAVARAVTSSATSVSVYAYMDAAEQSFLAVKKRGGKTIYELPTPYWRATQEIVQREAKLHPDWAATLPRMEEESPKMLRRDRELQLADMILVPSHFVKDSLALAPPFRGVVEVLPYGSPKGTESPASLEKDRAEGPLKVLFVGSLNQGKGLSYLAEAMKMLGDQATLTIIGSHTGDLPCPALETFLGQHRNRSGLSNTEVLSEMRQHDVLVLPTLYEGLALVVLEALSQGLAVVTTPESGFAGILLDQEEYLLVKSGDPQKLGAALQLLSDNPSKLGLLKNAAYRASLRFSWESYRQTLRNCLKKLF
jgi:glycosyltransferase involved in cell wall biosynthesis